MNVFAIWRIIFSRPKYFLTAVLVAAAFYLTNVVIASYKTIASFYSYGLLETIKLLVILALGFSSTIKLHSFITLIISSLLLGMLFSIALFKVQLKDRSISYKKSRLLGSLGIFLAAIAPGCAACGLGLAAVLGLSSAFIVALPFDGLEISLAAIGILIFAAINLSQSLLKCDSCNLEHINLKR